jgi:hypothetical protein
MSALFGRLGDYLGRPDVAQFAGMMIMMPLLFVSSAFAPLATMPGWMRTIAAFNPVAHATDALRHSTLGTASLTDITVAVASALALGDRHRATRGQRRVRSGARLSSERVSPVPATQVVLAGSHSAPGPRASPR